MTPPMAATPAPTLAAAPVATGPLYAGGNEPVAVAGAEPLPAGYVPQPPPFTGLLGYEPPTWVMVVGTTAVELRQIRVVLSVQMLVVGELAGELWTGELSTGVLHEPPCE